MNKNLIPFDPQPPLVTSGLRLGTPALTTRGMKETEMRKIAGLIDEAITHSKDEKVLNTVREKVNKIIIAFPLYLNLRKKL